MAQRPLPRARQSRLRVGLGTWVSIEASARRSNQVTTAIEAAFEAVREIEGRMHPTRSGSDLARINADAATLSGESSPWISGVGAFTVHPSTWDLLEFAKRLCALSDGVFDPCLPCRPGRLADIELRPGGVVLCHVPLKLDFGGFAKGYAIDRATEVLIEHGCSSGLVNVGGDLRVFGAQPRTILMRQPGGLFRPIELCTQALAVSCLETYDRPREHQGYYRRTNCPERAASQPAREAVVVATQAVTADALTKCVLLCAPEVAARTLRELGGTDIGQQPPMGNVAAVARQEEHSPGGYKQEHRLQRGDTPKVAAQEAAAVATDNDPRPFDGEQRSQGVDQIAGPASASGGTNRCRHY